MRDIKTKPTKHKRLVIFKEGDLVCVHLRKEQFPQSRDKLSSRADGPFKVLEHINDNTYKIELPETYEVLSTFNVVDLSPYYGEDKDSTEENTELFPTRGE